MQVVVKFEEKKYIRNETEVKLEENEPKKQFSSSLAINKREKWSSVGITVQLNNLDGWLSKEI